MQKLPKKPTKICGKNLLSDKLSGQKTRQKIFYDFLNKKPAKNFKYIQKLPNFTKHNQNKKPMKQLLQTDYVIYDKANDNPLQFSNGQVIIFSDKEEAINDCYGNEIVVSCTDLPMHWKLELLNQINS